MGVIDRIERETVRRASKASRTVGAVILDTLTEHAPLPGNKDAFAVYVRKVQAGKSDEPFYSPTDARAAG